MSGIVDGNNVFERLAHPSFWEHVRTGAHSRPPNDFLAEASARVRHSFRGPVTYASCRSKRATGAASISSASIRVARRESRTDFPRPCSGSSPTIDRWRSPSFCCCTYRGAADAGGRGFAILDLPTGNVDGTPPRLNSEYLRNDAEQAGSARCGLPPRSVGPPAARHAVSGHALGADGVVYKRRRRLLRAGAAQLTRLSGFARQLHAVSTLRLLSRASDDVVNGAVACFSVILAWLTGSSP